MRASSPTSVNRTAKPTPGIAVSTVPSTVMHPPGNATLISGKHVPDGGTVLLGGVKRLSEGRNEFGVPILNKIPYVNRLFANVGIGRDTQSLMMMRGVTIISRL